MKQNAYIIGALGGVLSALLLKGVMALAEITLLPPDATLTWYMEAMFSFLFLFLLNGLWHGIGAGAVVRHSPDDSSPAHFGGRAALGSGIASLIGFLSLRLAFPIRTANLSYIALFWGIGFAVFFGLLFWLYVRHIRKGTSAVDQAEWGWGD